MTSNSSFLETRNYWHVAHSEQFLFIDRFLARTIYRNDPRRITRNVSVLPQAFFGLAMITDVSLRNVSSNI